ncbi:MAG: serine/threonine protein kinase [Gammaproteobacteria bacterium]|nr:serine/threonine protein kinase [Gammaproteobacteria bacterium]MCF6362876.1 serine/threonine protein kinase [Gammaproteobacteria bacterium]
MEDDKTRVSRRRAQPTNSSVSSHANGMDPREGIEENDNTRVSRQHVQPANPSVLSHAGEMDMEAEKTRAFQSQTRPVNPSVASQASEIGSGGLINNRFRLEYMLGQGGMGVVYAARDLRKEELGDSDSRIAIKLLSQNVQHLPNALRMLQQECTKAQELAHPNVVTVYDFDRDGDIVYMTMELLAGQPLGKYMADKEAPASGQDTPVGISERLSIISDIVQGLAYAHKRGIVHFDLKPGNVFITEDGTTKILDFGIARAVLTSGNKTASGAPGLFDDMIALTPPYASLEMLRGMPPDPRDDIYALAIIAYKLLAGKHPFDELSAMDALRQNLKPERIPGLTDRQWKGLLGGLALQREDRTLSAEAFLEALLPSKVDRRYWLAVGTALTAVALSLFFWLQPPQIVAPSLFENPPPAAELTKADRQRIEQLLEIAEVHMMVGRLISPAGANALDVYNQVLSMHPYNRRAIQGLETVLDRLAQAAESALSDGERLRAEKLIDSGLTIYPQHKKLLNVKQRLSEEKP